MPPARSRPPTHSSRSGEGGARRGDGGGQPPSTPDPGSPPLSTPAAPNNYHSALLLGEDHTKLGEVAIREVTPNLAIGISRGRFPKGYAHVDPNEDAVFAATDGATTILAVADGHHGFDAARAAISGIADTAPALIGSPLESTIIRLAAAATTAVSEAVQPLSPPRDTSRTSLTIAAVRDNAVAATTIGDTAAFLVARRRPTRLGTDTEYLSPFTDADAIGINLAKISEGAMLVLASDGFLDFAVDPMTTLRAVAPLGASIAADRLVSDAFAGGAGDNITIAVAQRT